MAKIFDDIIRTTRRRLANVQAPSTQSSSRQYTKKQGQKLVDEQRQKKLAQQDYLKVAKQVAAQQRVEAAKKPTPATVESLLDPNIAAARASIKKKKKVS